MLTSRGIDYLVHQRAAARAIEDELRAELGEAALSALGALLDALTQRRRCACRVPGSLVQHLARAGITYLPLMIPSER